MLLDILRTIIVMCSTLLFFLSCNKKNSENQITIKIISIDSKTQKPRINTYDTIQVRKEGVGYLTKTFNKVGEYVTNSEGSFKIKIDNTKGYKFILHKRGFYGSENYGKPFTKEILKDGQEVKIEVISLEN